MGRGRSARAGTLVHHAGAASFPASLYRAGGLAALLAALIFRRNWGAEFVLLHSLGVIGVGPSAVPETAGDWFALLTSHPLIGLILLNLFDLVNYTLVAVMLLAVCRALRRSSPRAAAWR